MGSKQVGLLLTVMMLLLVLTLDFGNCNTQDQAKVVSVGSYDASILDDSESVLHRHSRSGHRSRRTALTPADKQLTIDLHNNFRRAVGASDMQILAWSDDLAIMAENWAQKCSYSHPPDLQDLGLGQNLAADPDVQQPINVTESILLWFNEKPNYNYDTATCTMGDCGHYIQVVWANSREIGCAYWNCPQITGWTGPALIFACDYRPGGNLENFRPFKIGAACSQCASRSWWCNEGLCDRSCTTPGPTCGCAPVCLNLAPLDMTKCSCSCAIGMYGSDCGAICQDSDPRCNPPPDVSGFTASFCNSSSVTGDIVRQLCPKMCGFCQAASDSNYSTKPSVLTWLSLSWLLICSFRSI